MTRHFGDPYAVVADPHLRRACELAERGRGTTAPNPVVGCVLVRDGEVVGEGWHERAGGPHAEAVALAQAGEAAHGSTAYVTLEPCSHTGRTPSCADALVREGVERVVVGMPDPNPLASGGTTILRRAGIDVVFADDPRPFHELDLEWLHRQSTGRPFVRAKMALTLDGRPALAQGVRSALTGEAAREFTMRLRAHADAVMVGTGTVAVDDPSLTVRDPSGAPAVRQPRRIVLTRTEQPFPDRRMFHDGLGAVTVLLPDTLDLDDGLAATGAVGLGYDIERGLSGVMEALASIDVVSLLIEPGPRLFGPLMSAGLVDELVLLHAGGLGGEEAPALFVGRQQDDPSTLTRPLRAVEAAVLGDDAVTVWRPRRTEDGNE
ncbi:MAG TPA: bifunctional diaminohydroxyphosphoribosylaminopyrimidine deaminase/5-amino-6-(5-phosphoribosylamino)uracil reductase RibD [Coriobacteriia bacterium]